MRIPITAIAMLTATGFAQVSSNISLSNGVRITFAAKSDQGLPDALKIDLEPASGNSF